MEVWGVVAANNTLGESKQGLSKIKEVYAQIIPQTGNQAQFGNVDPEVDNVSVTHKIKIRYYSFPEIKITNWLIYKGQKYEILSFNPDFKDRNYWEIMTKIVYE
jgi:head-tail adaptor